MWNELYTYMYKSPKTSPLELPSQITPGPDVLLAGLCQELEELKSKLGFTGFPVTAGGKMGQPLLGLVTKRDTDPWIAGGR